MAARPRDLSNVAHTTNASHRSPAVTKIFSPLITYAPPSRAVVVMAAESDPHEGSVMAIAAQRPPSRESRSGLATEAIAALPRPWPGMDRSSPRSAQHNSITDRTVIRLKPLRTPLSTAVGRPCAAGGPEPRRPEPSSGCRTALAPPSGFPDAFAPLMTAASRSSSRGTGAPRGRIGANWAGRPRRPPDAPS